MQKWINSIAHHTTPQTQSRSLTHSRALSLLWSRMHIHLHSRSHPYTYSRSRSHLHMHTRTRHRIHILYILALARTFVLLPTQSRSCSHSHTCIHTRNQTQMYTGTNTNRVSHFFFLNSRDCLIMQNQWMYLCEPFIYAFIGTPPESSPESPL